MRTFNQLFRAEWIKVRKSTSLLIILLLIALPVVYGGVIFTQIVLKQYNYTAENPWLMLLMMVQLFYGTVFLPAIVAIIVGTLQQFERKANHWSHLFLFPFKRSTTYFSKLTWIILLVAIAQSLMLSLVLLTGWLAGLEETIPLATYSAVFFLGTVGAISLGSLLFYLFLLISSTRVALSASIALSFPAFLAISNESGSFLVALYPWALPIFGMTHGLGSVGSSMIFLGICLIVILLSSFLSIQRLSKNVSAA